jgi:hypothetical protein
MLYAKSILKMFALLMKSFIFEKKLLDFNSNLKYWDVSDKIFQVLSEYKVLRVLYSFSKKQQKLNPG